MDVTKVRSAITAAQTAVQELVSHTSKEAIKALESGKDHPDAKGIADLAKAGKLLGKSLDRVAKAVERTTPKPKKAKEEKPADKPAKK